MKSKLTPEQRAQAAQIAAGEDSAAPAPAPRLTPEERAQLGRLPIDYRRGAQLAIAQASGAVFEHSTAESGREVAAWEERRGTKATGQSNPDWAVNFAPDVVKAAEWALEGHEWPDSHPSFEGSLFTREGGRIVPTALGLRVLGRTSAPADPRRTLSADVLDLGSRFRATMSVGLRSNPVTGSSTFRAQCRTDGPPPPALISQLQTLVRAAGYLDQRLTYDSPFRIQLDAR